MIVNILPVSPWGLKQSAGNLESIISLKVGGAKLRLELARDIFECEINIIAQWHGPLITMVSGKVW